MRDLTGAIGRDESIGRAKPGRLAVLYDGNCELCRACVDALRAFDNSDAIDPLNIHNEQDRGKFPNLRMENLMEELHVVDDRGQVWRGAGAINEILRRQHGIRGLIAWLWYIPGFAWMADRQYKRIARSRYCRDSRGGMIGSDAPPAA